MDFNSNEVVHVDVKTNYSLQEIIQKQEKNLKEESRGIFPVCYVFFPPAITFALMFLGSLFPISSDFEVFFYWGICFVIFVLSSVLCYFRYLHKTSNFKSWSFLNEEEMREFYALCHKHKDFKSYKDSIVEQKRLPIGYELSYLWWKGRDLDNLLKEDKIKSDQIKLKDDFLNSAPVKR